MAKTRRGGGIFDTIKSALGIKPSCDSAKKKSEAADAEATKATEAAAKAKATKDEVCASEASAGDVSSAAQGSAEMSGAPASAEPEPKLGARRRRRLTRRKYKGGKHRKGHRA